MRTRLAFLFIGCAALAASASTSGTLVSTPAPSDDLHHYDYYVLSLSWPPSIVAPAEHGRLGRLVKARSVSAGFWAHGLWPSRVSGHGVESCSQQQPFDLASLGPFVSTLAYYLRPPSTTMVTDRLAVFWSHEWSRHGTCSGTDQLTYFTNIFTSSLRNDVLAVLTSAGITPSASTTYSLGQLRAALTAAYGPAFDATHGGLTCIPSPSASGPPLVREVRLCISKTTLQPVDCRVRAAGPLGVPTALSRSNASTSQAAAEPEAAARMAGGDGAGSTADERQARFGIDTCGRALTDQVLFPEQPQPDGVTLMHWHVVLWVLLGALLLGVALVVCYQLLQYWRLIPALFTPRRVVEVHYNLVHQPVSVCVEPLHMEQLWDNVPHIAAFVEDLPVGMGIKGGIARKLLKERVGVPEPPGSFDVDVLLFVEELTPETRRAARETVTGCHLGGLILEPQDCEVLTKECLAEYFISRDVTQNEVLILKTAPGQAQLYFTEQARADCEASLIRPCVHAVKNDFHLVWEVEADGTPYTASQQVCRSLVRYLKGHGSDYAFDRATWEHYRRVGLSKTELFKVLRPFHDDDRKMQTAVDHLVDIGFLRRRDLRKAGGVNMLWGVLLQEVNATVSRYGGRFVLTSLDPDAVERWVESKKASTASRLITEEMRSTRTGFVMSTESVLELGLLSFPPQLTDFIAEGPVFDQETYLRLAAAAATTALVGSPHHDPAARSGGVLTAPGTPLSVAASSLHGEAAVPAGKARWQAVQSAAAVGGGLVCSVMRGDGPGTGRATPGRATPGGAHSAAGDPGTATHPATPGSARLPGSAVQMEDGLQREVERLRDALLLRSGRGSPSGTGGHTPDRRDSLPDVPAAAGGGGGWAGQGAAHIRTSLRRNQGEAVEAEGGSAEEDPLLPMPSLSWGQGAALDAAVSGGSQWRSLSRLRTMPGEAAAAADGAAAPARDKWITMSSLRRGQGDAAAGAAGAGGMWRSLSSIRRGGADAAGAAAAAAARWRSRSSIRRGLGGAAEAASAACGQLLAAPSLRRGQGGTVVAAEGPAAAGAAWLAMRSLRRGQGDAVEAPAAAGAKWLPFASLRRGQGDAAAGAAASGGKWLPLPGSLRRGQGDAAAAARVQLGGGASPATSSPRWLQGEASESPHAAVAEMLATQQRQLREMAHVAVEGRRRQNAAFKELLGATFAARATGRPLSVVNSQPGSPATPAAMAAAAAAAAAAASAATAAEPAGYTPTAAMGDGSSARPVTSATPEGDPLKRAPAAAGGGGSMELAAPSGPVAADWVSYLTVAQQQAKGLDQPPWDTLHPNGGQSAAADALGAFYQQGVASSGLMGILGWGDGGAGAGGDEDGFVPLVADEHGPKRKRPTLGKLFAFLVGVMAIDKPSLLAAYGLMLCGLVARLCVPRVEAALFDAFNQLDVDQFWASLLLAMGLVLADIMLTLCGQLAMEVFTRNSMRVLFRRFFEHVVFQDLPFFARLSPGELMARTSGDSLTLRGIVSSTIYKLVEGAVLFLGATALLIATAHHLLAGRPELALVFVAVAAVYVAEAGLLGVWLRRVNLAVRQTLGRMFGFTLGIFANIPLVSALGLELRCVSDYRLFAKDYFAHTLLLNGLLHAHNALTGLLAAVLRFSLLALGGAALFDGVTTVGSLIALLSYCAWLQRGLKQASDSWARLMAGLGSVERLVELHDRGTFGAVVPVDVGSAGADGEGPAGSTRLFRENDLHGSSEHVAVGAQKHKGAPHDAAEAGETNPLIGQVSKSSDESFRSGVDGDVEEGEVLTTGDAVHRRAFWTPGRPDRPDFGRMLGGVRLVGVQLTTRGRAENLLLRDVTMTVEAGQVAVLTGADPEGLHGLLSLLMLRYPPYKGSLAFQLPRGALPSAAALLGPDPLDWLLRRGGRQQAQQEAEGGGGAEWEWSTFSFRHDDLRPPRSRVALISRSMTGLFRTSVEDNVAVAAPDRQVTSAEVRRVCAAAGLHEEVNALPDGYFTLLGEGTGNSLSTHGLLRLAVARALLRRPALVLVEDVDAFAEALGEGALRGLLQQLRSEGAAVVVACGPAGGARWGWADVRLHLHAGALHAEGEAQ